MVLSESIPLARLAALPGPLESHALPKAAWSYQHGSKLGKLQKPVLARVQFALALSLCDVRRAVEGQMELCQAMTVF